MLANLLKPETDLQLTKVKHSTVVRRRIGKLGFLFSFSIYAIVGQRVFTKIIVDCSCQSKSYDFLGFEFEYSR